MNFNARLFSAMMRASRVLVNQISILSSVIWDSARRELTPPPVLGEIVVCRSIKVLWQFSFEAICGMISPATQRECKGGETKAVSFKGPMFHFSHTLTYGMFVTGGGR